MRLTSLDALRGLAIASMILVNNPGSWTFAYPLLRHADWHGFTPTDLVFPLFMFVMGVAMAFSLAKYVDSPEQVKPPYQRLIRRAVLLFALGLLLNFYRADLSTPLRVMGVLQRLGVAYLLASLAILNLSRRWLWGLAAFLLLGYWGAMMLVPVPNCGAANLSAECNLGGYVDRLVLGAEQLYRGGPFDPEGLFSTLPALVTVLIGYLTGDWLRSQPISPRTSIGLLLFGIGGIASGGFWGLVFPINKSLWTSSYTLFSGGLSLILLAWCYEFIEVRGKRHWGWPLEVMGLNAIFAFVGSGLVARVLIFNRISADTSYKTWIYQNWFQSWAGDYNGSLAFAIATVLLWWAILYAMYCRKWFVKV